MSAKTEPNNNLAIIALSVWAAVLIVTFYFSRGEDVGQAARFLSGALNGAWFGWNGLAASFGGVVTALLIAAAWFGLGSAITSGIQSFVGKDSGETRSDLLDNVRATAIGAAAWSLIWFFIGLGGGYHFVSAVVCLVVGLVSAAYFGWRARQSKPVENFDLNGGMAVGLVLLLLSLTLIAALAPPTAKDTLLYHFAVPKNFIAAGNNAPIIGNIASYLALGTEMHAVWAMLLGGIFGTQTAETAAGATIFAFFPLLAAAIYGWARELELNETFAATAVLLVVSIPTAFHVASNAYIDLALALFVTLAAHAVGRWRQSTKSEWLFYTAICLGAALAIKLTALFVFIALALAILLAARAAKTAENKNPNALLLSGFAALIGGGILASPWYLRTWAVTGSPIFPFYLNVWRGEAAGWDLERSMLFQIVNSHYGGDGKSIIDYLIAPFTVSLRAQLESVVFFDGVLGAAFLFGIVLVIWAARKFDLPATIKTALTVAVCLFAFWLFTSQQLRYLLPIFPGLAIAILFAADKLSAENFFSKRAIISILLIFGAVGASVSVVWFLQKAPHKTVFGGETRTEFLTRSIDYFPYYQSINDELPADSKVWLINMRRDSYHLDKPYFSDYMFEDWTLKKLVEESKSLPELQNKIKQLGVTHILARHDVLLDARRTVIFDEKRSENENAVRLGWVKTLILDEKNKIRSDGKFSLVRLP